MPNRYIRASAIESEAVNSLSWQAEVFFRRLLNRCDDFGRFTGNLALLRAAVFPLQLDRVKEADVQKLLAECEAVGLVFRYEADGKPFIVMNKWENGRAKTSEYPNPPADICERMKTYVYTRKHKFGHAPDPDSDPDTDTDTDSDKKGDLAFPQKLATDTFRAKWAEYLAYRKASHLRRLKPASVARQLAQLAEWGEVAACLAIDQTIRNGWQGIFPPGPQLNGQGMNQINQDIAAESVRSKHW